MKLLFDLKKKSSSFNHQISIFDTLKNLQNNEFQNKFIEYKQFTRGRSEAEGNCFFFFYCVQHSTELISHKICCIYTKGWIYIPVAAGTTMNKQPRDSKATSGSTN